MLLPALTGRILFFSIDVSPLVFYISYIKKYFYTPFHVFTGTNHSKTLLFQSILSQIKICPNHKIMWEKLRLSTIIFRRMNAKHHNSASYMIAQCQIECQEDKQKILVIICYCSLRAKHSTIWLRKNVIQVWADKQNRVCLLSHKIITQATHPIFIPLHINPLNCFI